LHDSSTDDEKFEAAVNKRLQEHTEALAAEVEKMTNAIKEDAEQEQVSHLCNCYYARHYLKYIFMLTNYLFSF
jgi:hypothetical protein